MFDLTILRVNLFVLVFLVLSAVPAFAQVQSESAVPASAVCLIGDHPGIHESDAQTAAMLVCYELRKQGISVGDPVYQVQNSANVYRVVLRRLGEKVLVRLSWETPVGTVASDRQLLLGNIEEMISAAPRLVEALIHQKPIDTTVNMENVVEQDAPVHRKITGESLWNIGIFGTFVPDTGIKAKPGWEIGWSYEVPDYDVGTELRFTGGGDEWGEDFGFISWSIGGRYFFNNQNFSPYLGGGLAISGASYTSDDRSGLGAYAVFGMEALRLTRSRLRLELRVDAPFFKLNSSPYLMPITLGISYHR